MGEKVLNNLHSLLAQTTPLLTAPTRWDSPSLLKKDRLCLALIQMQCALVRVCDTGHDSKGNEFLLF